MLLTIATPASAINASNTRGLIFSQECEYRALPGQRLSPSQADGSNLTED